MSFFKKSGLYKHITDAEILINNKNQSEILRNNKKI